MDTREDRFADRTEAGRLFAERLRHLAAEDPVVLALPRGGVPVGPEIAKALQAPLDLVLVREQDLAKATERLLSSSSCAGRCPPSRVAPHTPSG